MKGNLGTAGQAFEVYLRTADGRVLAEHQSAPPLNAWGEVDQRSQVCWLECPPDLDQPFEVVVLPLQHRNYHVRAELYADGEYIDGHMFEPHVLRTWKFDKIIDKAEGGMFKSNMTFSKIELIEEEEDATPKDKLNDLGEIRIAIRAGEVRVRPQKRKHKRHGGQKDSFSGVKKVYEKDKKATIDRTVNGSNRVWHQARPARAGTYPQFIPYDKRDPGYVFRFKYLSRAMLLANGVIRSGSPDAPVHIDKQEEASQAQLSDFGLSDHDELELPVGKRYFERATSTRESSPVEMKKPDITNLPQARPRNFVGSILQPIDLTNA